MSSIKAIIDFGAEKAYVVRNPDGKRNWGITTDTESLRIVTTNEMDHDEIEVAIDCFRRKEKAKGLRKKFLRKTGQFVDVSCASNTGGLLLDHKIWMNWFTSRFDVSKSCNVCLTFSAGIVLYGTNGKVREFAESKRKALRGSVPYDKMWTTGSVVDVIDLRTNQLVLTYFN